MTMKGIGSLVLGVCIGIGGGVAALVKQADNHRFELSLKDDKIEYWKNAYGKELEKRVKAESRCDDLDPNSQMNRWRRLVKTAKTVCEEEEEL